MGLHEWQYRKTVLVLCTLALFVTVFGRLALSPVVPDIATEFHTSNTLIGGALTGMWFTYALTQFPSGILADRFGDRRLILVSVGGTGLSALLIVAAPTFGVFVLGVVILGAVAGLHYSVATALITRIYDGIGTAIGIHNSGAPLAGLLAPVVVSGIAVRFGWRPAVAVGTLVALPITALIAAGIRSSEPRQPDEPMRDQVDREKIVEVLTRPTVVFTGIIAIIVEFSWQGLASFLPAFFVQYHGYSQTLAGTLFAAYFVVQGVLQTGVGVVADRLGRDIAIVSCMVFSIAGIGLLLRGSNIEEIALGIGLLGLGMSWGAAVFPRFMDRIDEGERGFGFGLFRTVYMIAAATGSVALGFLADQYGWVVSLSFLVVLLVLVCGLLAINSIFSLDY
nr:MFS transporter [Halomicroarcula amylolytica]